MSKGKMKTTTCPECGWTVKSPWGENDIVERARWCKTRLHTRILTLTLPAERIMMKIVKDIHSRGGRDVYPTIIVDNRVVLTNPDERKLRQILEF